MKCEFKRTTIWLEDNGSKSKTWQCSNKGIHDFTTSDGKQIKLCTQHYKIAMTLVDGLIPIISLKTTPEKPKRWPCYWKNKMQTQI